MTPKISVIIPTYNRWPRVSQAVDSVLRQTWTDFELLLVDDGSTDETLRHLKQNIVDPRVRFFQTANRGVSAARNYGIDKSVGEWVAFLDSDDRWLPEKLEKQMACIKNQPELVWIHGEEIWIRNGVRVNPMKKHKKSAGDIFPQALKLCCVSPSTVMIQRRLFQEVGVFREDFPVCEDYDLWLKISAYHPVGFVEDAVIEKYGGHSDQLSRRYRAMDYWRILSIDTILQKNLDLSKKQLAEKELVKKAKILLKGYRKHANLSEYDQIFYLLRQVVSDI